MSDANQEIHVIAEAQAKPGQDAALRDVLKACVAPTRAEQGNRGYGSGHSRPVLPVRDLDEPRRPEAALADAPLQDSRPEFQATPRQAAIHRSCARSGLGSAVRRRLIVYWLWVLPAGGSEESVERRNSRKRGVTKVIWKYFAQ